MRVRAGGRAWPRFVCGLWLAVGLAACDDVGGDDPPGDGGVGDMPVAPDGDQGVGGDMQVVGDGGVPDAAAQGDGGEGPVMVAPCIETVRVGGVEVFAYEASRPDATGEAAGADGSAVCSRAGVLPWTTITWADANRACMASGFRLCNNEEWQTACQGPDRLWSFPYGSSHRTAVCNEHVSGSGMLEATGSRAACRTPEGIYDLSGNVWEVTTGSAKRGASWKVNASMFRVDAARCDMYYDIGGEFADDDVGFRCCRD